MPTEDLPAHQPHGLDEGPWGVPDLRVAVVIPMFNEESVVGSVVANVRRQFPYVVCVDDGSGDDSPAEAAAAGAVVVRHAINLGQGAALKTGIEMALLRAETDYVVTFDADGQHRVVDAVRLVDEARVNKLDVALGSRFLSDEHDIP
ncbi:MAG: glycosyltransferase family 2 protein, partial [Nocardioides sp.]